MEGDITQRVKEIINFFLTQIDEEDYRFILLFRLGKRQLFLFNIYEPNKGFLSTYKGMQLYISESFLEIYDKDSYEQDSPIVSDYPFLYGDFIDSGTLYVKNIGLNNTFIGSFEFITKKGYISQYIKQVIDYLIETIKESLFELYIDIREDIAKRYFAIDALNIIKNARPRTYYHSFRVADLAVAIAVKLGLDKKTIRNLCYAALIHDIGEIYIPRDIFYKESNLTKEEMDIIKQHPEALKSIFDYNPIMNDIVDIAYYHHERLDAKGYFGCKAEELSMPSRILALCEFIDGLHTDRPGRKGYDMKQILAIVKRSSGHIFDSEASNAAIEIIDKYDVDKTFELAISNSISNIGKPVVILESKQDDIRLIQGRIEYISSRIMGISFKNRSDLELKSNGVIRVQFSFFDTIYDYIGSIISVTDSFVNISIKETFNSLQGNLNVYWEFEAIAVPLRLSGAILDSKQAGKNFVKIRTKRFGTKSLSAKIENPSTDLNIGDTVILKMKPHNKVISIPAVVSNIMKEEGVSTVYFEYFSLDENTDSLIHRAIYFKQSQSSA